MSASLPEGRSGAIKPPASYVGIIYTETHPEFEISKSECASHLVEEATVGIQLRHVPHHDAAEAVELRRVLDGGGELCALGVPCPGARVGGDAEHNLDVGVLARLPGPGVPHVKVEGGLGGRPLDEAGDAAGVVVELDHDEVEGDASREGLLVGDVRVGALGRGGDVVLLAGGRRGGVHEAAELDAEGDHVARGGLEVVVKAVDGGGAEGAEDVGTAAAAAVGAGWAEHGPEVLGGSHGVGGRGEAAARVGCAAQGEDDGLACGLAGDNVLPGTTG